MSFAAPFDRKAFEDAIHDWIVASTGLPSDSVLAEHQDAPQPVHPYATFKIASIMRQGGEDETRTDDDPRRDAGAEVEITLCGLRLASVSVNVFTRSNDALNDAMALASTAQAALSMETIASLFTDAKLAVTDEGQIRDLSQLESNEWVQRAQFDVGIQFASNMIEYVGYIESVVVDIPVAGIDNETFSLAE